MSTSQRGSSASLLPIPGDAYDRSNEQQTRRTIEERLSDLEVRLNSVTTTQGSLALGITELALSNGSNDNVATGYTSLVVISGPSASFSITGITAGETGRLLFVRNSTSQQMTIANQSASSTASNRIITHTGADLVLTGASGQCVVLAYDALAERWIVVGKQESSDT